MFFGCGGLGNKFPMIKTLHCWSVVFVGVLQRLFPSIFLREMCTRFFFCLKSVGDRPFDFSISVDYF